MKALADNLWVSSSNARINIVDIPLSQPISFASDVAAALSAQPKTPLPPKYFYDDLGSALFEAITYLPQYYLTRAETQILRDHGAQIVKQLEGPLDVLELGSGNSVKTRFLIKEALRTQGTLRYSAVDISRPALVNACTALADGNHRLVVYGYAGDYFDVLASPLLLRTQPNRRLLALCLGSNIGNYAPEDAARLIGLLASRMAPGDALLMGTDMKKDRAILERAYDDEIGVMAAFGKNLLVRINRELGADFHLNDFKHIVLYNEQRGSVDSYLEAQRSMDVPIPGAGIVAHFDEGEMVHTEASMKFGETDVMRLAGSNGLSISDTWYDASHGYAMHLLIR